MTSLIMGSARAPVQRAEEDVRSTLDPVDAANAPAVSEDAPDYNELETYADNDDGVVRPHQVGGEYTASEQSPPFWGSAVSESGYGVEAVNRQVSSSGTAAAREMAGQFGHGTMARTESIEPQVREGAAFGADYFRSNVLGANPTGGDYMTPQVGDPDMNAVAAAFAGANARAASQSVVYGDWLGSMVGNV